MLSTEQILEIIIWWISITRAIFRNNQKAFKNYACSCCKSVFSFWNVCNIRHVQMSNMQKEEKRHCAVCVPSFVVLKRVLQSFHTSFLRTNFPKTPHFVQIQVKMRGMCIKKTLKIAALVHFTLWAQWKQISRDGGWSMENILLSHLVYTRVRIKIVHWV